MKHWIVLALLYSAFAALAWHQIPGVPYPYDEADYMFAASRGLRANYTDSPTMPIGEFVRTGLSRGRATGARTELSEQIRSSNDIVFYRHWHGPLYFYWLLSVSRFSANPQIVRTAQLIFPILGGLLIWCGCLRLLPDPCGWYAAILSTALYLWSEAVLRSPELAPHQLFALCSLGVLFLLAAMMKTGERRYWYGAVVCSALAACTLEVAFVPAIAVLICGHLKRRELGTDLRFAAKSAALFLLTLLAIWPGAILRLSFLKAYAFMAWLAIFRSHAWGTDMSIGQVWLMRFEHAPLEWLIIVAGVIALLRAPSGERRMLLPFGLFALLMIAAVFRVNGDSARYTLPFMPALDVLAGVGIGCRLASMSRTTAAVVLGVLCVGLFCSRWYSLRSRPLGDGAGDRQVLAWVHDHGLEHSRLLVPHDELPMLHYYFPNASITGYTDDSSLAADRARGGFAAILWPGEPLRYELNPQP